MKIHYLTSTHAEGTRHKAIGDGTVAIFEPDDVIEIECQGEGCRFCELEAQQDKPLDIDLQTEEVTEKQMASMKAQQLKSGTTYKGLQASRAPPGDAKEVPTDEELDSMLKELNP